MQEIERRRAAGPGLVSPGRGVMLLGVAHAVMGVAPLLVLVGRLVESAQRAGDDRALSLAGRTFTVAGAAGLVLIRRSGSPGLLALGLWMARRGRLMRDGRCRAM